MALTAEVRCGEIPPKSGGPDWKARSWLLSRLRPTLFSDGAVAKASSADAPEQAERTVVNIFPPSSETARVHAEELAAKAAK